MRLIDADVMDYSIIRYLPKSFESIESLCDAWKKLVENQPTAYDVDKVVEQLEKDSKESQLVTLRAAFKVAVEVVKSAVQD